VWVQPFYLESGYVHWRTENEGIPPAGLFISSPYDVEARYGNKPTTSGVGYKVHVTETCEDDAPHIIAHAETTAAPVSDGAVTPHSHQALERQGLLPTTPSVDTGDLDAELLVTSQREYSRKLHTGLMQATSRSIGSRNGLRAQAGIPASAGRQPWMTVLMRSSRSNAP